MKNLGLHLILGMCLLAGSQAADPENLPAPDWKAGVASAVITPQQPLPMAGYAGRKEPAEGTAQELHAKALALEDLEGRRTVIVTLDLIGVIDRLRTQVAEQVWKQHQLPSACLLMNASHTHCGPAYGRDDCREYFDTLSSTVVRIVGEALATLEPAKLTYAHARCGFAMNRRTLAGNEYRNHPNPGGPVDHAVPVLGVSRISGELRGVLFGYACHNTTMGFRKWLGDYAGYAQQYLEESHPGTTALFLMGCGADQNPYPRSQLEYAQWHGRSLACAVEAALETGQKTPLHQRGLRGPLRCALETVELEHIKPDRPGLAYPVQVIRFGGDLCIVALGTETVVDYALRLKRELTQPSGPAVWVAGYSNLYSGYIASRRILEEGGYEAVNSPWKPSLEDRITGKAHELFERTGNETAPPPATASGSQPAVTPTPGAPSLPEINDSRPQ